MSGKLGAYLQLLLVSFRHLHVKSCSYRVYLMSSRPMLTLDSHVDSLTST